MRAISAFSLEAGTSTFGWRAWIALRTRVSMSAIGSLVIILLLHFLPASLGHTRNLAIEGELAQERAGPSTSPAAVAVAALKFGRFGLAGLFQLYVFRNFCGCGHLLILLLTQPGTACPFASTAPGPPHRCGPWW